MPPDFFSYKYGELMLRSRERIAGIRLRSSNGASYTFVAHVPGRDGSGFWSRAFLVLFTLAGALLCCLLARMSLRLSYICAT